MIAQADIFTPDELAEAERLLAAYDHRKAQEEAEALDLRPLPFFLVAPLTGEQAEAAEKADIARWRTENKLAELHKHRAARAPNCGKGATLHIRRPRDGGAVEDALLKTSCGRSDCPHCWRRRLTKTYRRAMTCLLDAPPEPDEPSRPGRKHLPRVGLLHVAEVDWLGWDALDRSIRRQHGGDCGRLRVRRTDNTVLVVCAHPFREARPVSPSEALELTSAAIDLLHTARHAYRHLGDWNDREATEWRLVQRHREPIDFADVSKLLEALGHRARRLKLPDLAALLWRADSEAAADRMMMIVLASAGARPSFASGEKETSGPKSDTAGGGTDDPTAEGWRTPFDPEPDGGGQS